MIFPNDEKYEINEEEKKLSMPWKRKLVKNFVMSKVLLDSKYVDRNKLPERMTEKSEETANEDQEENRNASFHC